MRSQQAKSYHQLYAKIMKQSFGQLRQRYAETEFT